MNPLRRLATSAAVAVLFAFCAVPNTYGSSIDLATPSGLNPGDKFRFLAVTNGVTGGNSPDINFYNTFVQTQSAGAKYGGATINWKAIASTATVDARDNITPGDNNVGIYTPITGTLLATNLGDGAGGIWSGSLLNSPSETVTGNFTEGFLWTGSFGDGTANLPLGGDPYATVGLPSQSNLEWINYAYASTIWNNSALYALSDELTVPTPSAVPEIDPAGMGSVLALIGGGLGLLERRRKRA